MNQVKKKIVTSIDDVAANIITYQSEIARFKGIQSRISQHRSWFAIKDEKENWIFGPSKFIGYSGNNANEYLKEYNRMDGRETEPALHEWFDTVPEGSALEASLKSEFREFASDYQKPPSKRWRVSVPKGYLLGSGLMIQNKVQSPNVETRNRISTLANVCGGRPCIAGTRMRVNDIIEMVADGATHEEILKDFPYLEKADIVAALKFAARSLDHAIVRAA